jgi:hypothetical protein
MYETSARGTAMFILYFDGQFHEYYHSAVYNGWTAYDNFRPGEGFWLVPGTDPEDDAYGRFDLVDDEDENECDENDETLEYMADLLEAHEIEPGEFRRQLLSVGYHPDTISDAIAQVAA